MYSVGRYRKEIYTPVRPRAQRVSITGFGPLQVCFVHWATGGHRSTPCSSRDRFLDLTTH